eukprot:363291-Chlamydomonas_euryale.AAC.10
MAALSHLNQRRPATANASPPQTLVRFVQEQSGVAAAAEQRTIARMHPPPNSPATEFRLSAANTAAAEFSLSDASWKPAHA